MRYLRMMVGLATLAISGCGLAPEKMSETDVDSSQKAAAQALATKLMEACRDGRFEPLGDEAIAAMRDGLTPEKQKAACASMTGQFGDYTGIDYAETWKQRGLRIYRFKGHFSRSEPEIRVVMDGDNKLSGFWFKPWSDTLR
jgi:hypothetical protein